MCEKDDQKKAITSKELQKEWTEERKRQGLEEIPPINNVGQASTGNLARMDKSWKNAADFFLKMIKRNK